MPLSCVYNTHPHTGGVRGETTLWEPRPEVIFFSVRRFGTVRARRRPSECTRSQSVAVAPPLSYCYTLYCRGFYCHTRVSRLTSHSHTHTHTHSHTDTHKNTRTHTDACDGSMDVDRCTHAVHRVIGSGPLFSRAPRAADAKYT